MNSGIDTHLRAFNRKERYWLLRNAVGDKFMSLDKDFLKGIEKALLEKGKPVEIPESAWFAVDYHFDWIYGAIVRHFESVTNTAAGFPLERRLVAGTDGVHDVVGNQEDADLIIAFDRTIILIEAKFDGGWINKQSSSKWNRYRDLDVFQRQIHSGSDEELLKFHFVLTSRGDRKKPANDELAWVPLKCEQSSFSRVERCTRDPDKKPRPSKEGRYWQIIPALREDKQPIGRAGD